MIQVFSISLVLLISLSFCSLIHDHDLWWHLTVGKWIVANRMLPSTDYWNAFSSGEWRPYSWLAETVFYLIYEYFSFDGLFYLKLAFISLLLFSLLYVFSYLANSRLLGLMLLVATSIGFKDFVGLRPQTISWIFFVWSIYLAERVRRDGLNKSNGFFLFILIALWSNIHITSIFGIFLVIVWNIKDLSKESVIRLSKLFLLLFTASLLTPHFGAEWLTLASKSSHPLTHSYIREFQPSTIYLLSTLVLVSVSYILAELSCREKLSMRAGQYLLLAVFFVIGMAFLKFSSYAVILSIALLAELCSRSKKLKQLLSLVGEYFSFKLLGFVSLIVLVPIVLKFWVLQKVPSKFNSKLYPVAAVDYILEEELPGPILNNFDEGGYLIFRFANSEGNPTRKVSIDGRTNVNSAQITKTFVSALHLTPEWESYIDLVKPKTIIWPKKLPLSEVLKLKPEWKQVFPDKGKEGDWLVFLRS